MTTQDASPDGKGQISTKAFHAAYVLAAVVATVGWAWALGYLVLALLGY